MKKNIHERSGTLKGRGMVNKRINYKVPNGKLIRIEANLEGNVLKDVKITGDFFLYPEEKVEEIEKALHERKLLRKEIEKTILKVVKENKINLLGVSVKDFVDALMMLRS